MVKKSSIIKVTAINDDDGDLLFATTLGLVSKLNTVANFAYCKHSLTSVNGGEFKTTKSILSCYKGEYITNVELVNQDDFDLFYDNIGISRRYYKDLK